MGNDNNQLDDFFGLKPERQEGTALPAGRQARESIKDFLRVKLSPRSRLRLLPKVLSPRERYLILGLMAVALGAVVSLPFTAYHHYTKALPDYGGSFTESVLGEPHLINPLLSQGNDADRDLATLVYSGLLKYDENGKLVPDLAKSYEISSDGLNYTVYVKDNAVWHDGKPVTADDVIYTVQTAQNPDYVSSQRVSWQGVDVERINDRAVMFKLKNKYAQFLNNLTMGILPKHLWQDVKPINVTLSELNLKPVGSGPYQFKKLKKDNLGRIVSYELEANKHFYNGRPYLDGITLTFYSAEDEMIDAYNRSEIENLGFISAQNLKRLKFKGRLAIHDVKLPRYFATFLNQNQSKALSDKNVRLALNAATDRAALIHDILDGNGVPVTSPMIGGILDIPAAGSADYNPDHARNILDAGGWSVGADGIRTKGKERLAVKLTTSTWPELTQVAAMLKTQWKLVGVEVSVETLPISQLQQVIKDRDYQALLFGEILNIDPDPFSLWHSSQKRDPGLNLALYDDKTADNLLEEARQTLNPLERAKKYDDFQKLVVADVPAVFLYSPYYLYGQARDIKGFATQIISMPSDRFANIEHWYINTKRVFK